MFLWFQGVLPSIVRFIFLQEKRPVWVLRTVLEIFGADRVVACVSARDTRCCSLVQWLQAWPVFPLQTHPNVDKKLFTAESQIGLKNPEKSFPINSDVGVLKWRLQTTEESFIPLTSECERASGCLEQPPAHRAAGIAGVGHLEADKNLFSNSGCLGDDPAALLKAHQLLGALCRKPV